MKKKKYRGKPPLDATLLAEKEGWELWSKAATNGWFNLKLIHLEPRNEKGNFWLGYNGERFAQNRDLVTLQEHEPEMLRWVEEVLKREKHL